MSTPSWTYRPCRRSTGSRARALIAIALLIPACASTDAQSGAADAPTSAQKAPAPTKSTSIELNLAVGELKAIRADDIASYTMGVPGVADARLSPNNSHIIVVALRPGNTALLALLKNGQQVTYNVTVNPRASTASATSTRNNPADVPTGAQKAPAPTKWTSIELNLVVGELKAIPAEDIARYTLAVRGVADTRVSPDKGSIIVAALEPGSTTLLAILKNGQQVTYNVTVNPRASTAGATGTP
jgi:hypothetical protein